MTPHLDPSPDDERWLRQALGSVVGEEQPTTRHQSLRDLAIARRALRRRRVAQGIVAVAAASAALLPLNTGLLTSNVGGDAVIASPDSTTNAPRYEPALERSGEHPLGLVLQADGVYAITDKGRVTARLGKSTDADVIKVLDGIGAGEPSVRQKPKCVQGPRTRLGWRGGFSALFNGQRFVGWLDEGQGRTREGAKVGISYDLLRELIAPDDWKRDAASPNRATFKGINGTFDGTRSTAAVTSLWAGETC